MENPKQAFVEYASSRNNEVAGEQFTTNQGPINFNKAANAWKDKQDFNWARTQTFTSLQNGSFSTYSSNYQTRLERVLITSQCNVSAELLLDHEQRVKVKKETIKSREISNFVGRVKLLKVFVGNFTYECDFVVLEDTTSIIDHYLGGMVFRKRFVKETRLVYNKDEGTITFEKGKENITFKMPHKMERFKHIDKDILKTDNIPPFVIIGNDGDQ
nr:protein kinase-like domain, concanavalin A-like lectin/glucanase domain protein [Tanacetum cinerariifolium]